MVDPMGIGIDDEPVDRADSVAVRVDDIEALEADHGVIDISRIEITET
jgi:hypothetical protein